MTNTNKFGELPAMVALPVEITLVSPVCLSAGVPTGNLTETLDYIPGSSVRGMLAQHYLERGPVDEAFRCLFLSGEVTYGNLYFSHKAEAAAPAPLSAYSCKHEPGFKADEDRHGVIDLLLQSFSWKRQNETGAPISPPASECSLCRAPLERFSSFYSPLDGLRETVPTASLHRIMTRSATDDSTQTAAGGLLYSVEVLDSTAMKYLPAIGSIICSTNQSFELAQQHLFGPFQVANTFFVGTARSRGLGEIVTAGRPVSPSDPMKHSALLASQFHRYQEVLKQANSEADRMYFCLTLHSDAIIKDEYFQYRSIIRASDLAREIDIGPERIKLEICFAEAHNLGGWNAALRAPKTDAVAIRMGSVFLYSIDELSEQVLLEKLVALEMLGIGDRRNEGFGRLRICDPFHLDLRRGQL